MSTNFHESLTHPQRASIDRSMRVAESNHLPGVEVIEHRVEVADEFTNDRLDYVTDMAEQLARQGFYGNTSLDDAMVRARKSDSNRSFRRFIETRRMRENPPTKELYGIVEGYSDWRSMVPTAAALMPIYDPTIETMPNGQPMTQDLHDWLSNLYDGRGIRSRAKVVESTLIDTAHEIERDHGGPATFTSLACGAAPTVLAAMDKIRQNGYVAPRSILVDYDSKMLDLVSERVKELHFDDEVSVVRQNVLDTDGLTASPDQLLDKAGSNSWYRQFGSLAFALMGQQRVEGPESLAPESSDIVEAVGILEYLKEDDWPYRYNKVLNSKVDMAGAVTFIKNAYELVKPGGRLLLGNMLDTHPQLGFTLNVVQWPHIQPRSIDKMLELIGKSGIEVEKIDVLCPDDGVYAIYDIRKPTGSV